MAGTERADRWAFGVDVHRDLKGCLGVQQHRVVDRLGNGGVGGGDNRGDGVHHLGQVGHPHPVAVPDEDVQIGGYGQGVGEGVTLLKRPVVGAEPDVPLVVGDPGWPRDLLGVGGAFDERPGSDPVPMFRQMYGSVPSSAQ